VSIDIAKRAPVASRARQHGVSLVELMVGLIIGLVLVGGMITVFAGSKRSGEVNTTLTELQDSARFAMDSIVRDVRLAGFQGCADSADGGAATVRATNAPTGDFEATALRTYLIEADGDWNPPPPPGFTPPAQGSPGAPVPGTHALAAQFGSLETWPIEPMANLFSPLVLADGVKAAQIGLIDGDVAMVSDCQRAEIFTVSGVNGSSILHDKSVNQRDGSNDGRLLAAYGEPPGSDRLRARVMRFEANLYYVGDTGRSNSTGAPVHALYRLGLPYLSPPPDNTPRPPIEMVEGVTHLSLRLGMSRRPTDAAFDLVAPDAVDAAAGLIRQVELGLLLQSFDPIAERDDDRRYRLAGRTLVPGTVANATTYRTDRRMRLAFNTTIDIRNR